MIATEVFSVSCPLYAAPTWVYDFATLPVFACAGDGAITLGPIPEIDGLTEPKLSSTWLPVSNNALMLCPERSKPPAAASEVVARSTAPAVVSLYIISSLNELWFKPT